MPAMQVNDLLMFNAAVRLETYSWLWHMTQRGVLFHTVRKIGVDSNCLCCSLFYWEEKSANYGIIISFSWIALIKPLHPGFDTLIQMKFFLIS